MDKSGIYYIQNLDNGKIYIGSAVSIVKRWSVHKHHLRRGAHCNKYLQSAWDKRGEDSFIFGVIEVVDKNILLEKEQFWIKNYESSNREKGYNLAPAAGSMLGYKHTEKTKSRLRIVGFPKGHTPWNKGKNMEGEYKENFVKAMRSEEVREARRNRVGFKHTDEAKKKISAASSRRTASEETRKKKSKAMTGKKLGESHRLNCIKAWEKRKAKGE
jgi:group I intron endonuclease